MHARPKRHSRLGSHGKYIRKKDLVNDVRVFPLNHGVFAPLNIRQSYVNVGERTCRVNPLTQLLFHGFVGHRQTPQTHGPWSFGQDEGTRQSDFKAIVLIVRKFLGRVRHHRQSEVVHLVWS